MIVQEVELIFSNFFILIKHLKKVYININILLFKNELNRIENNDCYGNVLFSHVPMSNRATYLQEIFSLLIM